MKVYNTLTKRKEEFIPREPGKVAIYVCGVTPYNFAHIGNARPPVFWDVARRFLKYRGYKVTYIQNFTDVDDKIIARSTQLGREPLDLAAEYARIYLEDLATLGVMPADRYPKVSEHIPEIIEMIRSLIARGHAYELNGDVYFEVGSFKDYGKLSGRSLEEMRAGARVEVNEAKRDPMDFALWKAAKPGEISWDSPWGPGRPGWHIECSAMSLKYLGNDFDIHGGGEDLIFPHHENEIAQSEGSSGIRFVRYWMHNAFITVGGERMGKSLGNFSTIREVLAKFPPRVIRIWFIGTHYRNPISFGETELTAASRGLERLDNAEFNWGRLLESEAVPGDGDTDKLAPIKAAIAGTEEQFVAAMEDDFNTPQALASLYDLVREVNRFTQGNDFQLTQGSQAVIREALDKLTAFEEILGIGSRLFTATASGSGVSHGGAQASSLEREAIEALIAKRAQAKKEKNWALADGIRDELKAKGILIEDTPQGVRLRKV